MVSELLRRQPKSHRFLVTLRHICEIGGPIDWRSYQPDGERRYPPVSYELRKSVVIGIALQNRSSVPVYLDTMSVCIVFSPKSRLRDLWYRVREGGNWGDPYAIVFSYPPQWTWSMILPKGLSSSHFDAILCLSDAETGELVPLLEPFVFPPKSEERVWTLGVVLPDYVARVLAIEEVHISRAGLVLRTVEGQDVRVESKVTDYPVSATDVARAEGLVERAISTHGQPGEPNQT
jgi:hypothetical protein